MSLANDKTSIPARIIAGNAAVANRVIRSGFQNVLLADAFAFESGNRSERVVFVGEEAPSTNYDSYAIVGDEYWNITYSSNVPATFDKYVRTADGWSRVVNWHKKTVEVTAAELKALNTTEKEIIAAPGANKGIVLKSMSCALDSGTTTAVAFDGVAAGEDIVLAYGAQTSAGNALATLETTGFCDQTTNSTALAALANPVIEANQSADLINSGAIFAAAGNMGMNVTVEYEIVSVPNVTES